MTRIDCQGIAHSDLDKSAQVILACESIAKDGYAILDNVLSEETVLALAEEFQQRFANDPIQSETATTLQVGTGRFMAPVELTGLFSDPAIYANPVLVAVVRTMLGHDAVLDNFYVIVSLNGSEQQHFHRDSPALFDSAIAAMLPAYALNVVIPLAEMNEVHGSTQLWPGSHRLLKADRPLDDAASYVPTVPIGSVLIWDYRLYHRGTTNRSDRIRPILSQTFTRGWYLDYAKFQKRTQRRLLFDDEFLDSVPKDRRYLFSRVL